MQRPAPAAKPNRLLPNLDRKGRLVRAMLGAVLACAALVSYQVPWLALVLGLSAGFVFFEAWKGWCALRACGIKTRF